MIAMSSDLIAGWAAGILTAIILAAGVCYYDTAPGGET